MVTDAPRLPAQAGYEVGDDNTCEKIEVKKPTAKREEPKGKREQSGTHKANR